MALALSDRALARKIGYTEATRQKDALEVSRENAPYLAVYAKARSRLRMGTDSDAVDRWRDQALRTLRERTLAKPLAFLTLTADQRRRLTAVLAERYGVWTLTAPEVASQIGLDEEARGRVERARQSLTQRFMAEERASNHARLVMEGAPPRAIAASDELSRVTDAFRFSENTDTPPEVRRKIDALCERTARPVPSTLVEWFASHRVGLEKRRKAAWRQEAESALLASLTPEQRARWDALARSSE